MNLARSFKGLSFFVTYDRKSGNVNYDSSFHAPQQTKNLSYRSFPNFWNILQNISSIRGNNATKVKAKFHLPNLSSVLEYQQINAKKVDVKKLIFTLLRANEN